MKRDDESCPSFFAQITGIGFWDSGVDFGFRGKTIPRRVVDYPDLKDLITSFGQFINILKEWSCIKANKIFWLITQISVNIFRLID